MPKPTLRKALRSFFLTVGEITSIVDQRIYPSYLPKDAPMPAVVLRLISGVPRNTLEDRTRLVQSRIQVYCCSRNDKDEADILAKCVQQSGICALRQEIDGITFLGSTIESYDEDDDEPPTDGNSEYLYTTTFDLFVNYWEAA